MKQKLFSLLIFISVISQSVYAQKENPIWNEVTNLSSDLDTWKRSALPDSYITYQLDFDLLISKLANAPMRSEAKNVNGVFVDLPLNNKLQKFEVYDAPVLASDLQDRLSNVHSYIGRSVDNKNILIRFSVSLKGFNAIILNDELGTQYIDSYTKNNQYCILYFKKDLSSNEEIVCLNESEEAAHTSFDSSSSSATDRNVDDGQLREFRLALACTQEYATYHLFQLGLSSASDTVKKDAILNVMNDVMTRVNAVYENELSVTMTIVNDNSNVVFLQDSFLSNNDISELIDQSQTWIDIFLGSENYDIGHMLSTSGSGLAQLYSPCTNNKARAVSGGLSSIPEGTVFENTMMHEMGHQFGAFHTYNSTSCASAATSNSAYEPGGGTTIMSYAGICGSSSNIQSEADNYFHQNSIDQMWGNITNGNSTCGNQSSTGNTAPVANAGGNYTIPIGTPYRLAGVATDIDGLESLTYCWEEYDLGASVAAPNFLTSTGPIVRSFPPSSNSTRYIPKLEDYVSSVNSSTTWEKLVLINRDVNYSLLVRDNDISGGQVGLDFMTVTVSDSSGAFTVSSQNTTGLSYTGSTIQTVTWNVGNTNVAPINSNIVNILLSTDGGLNFDTVLLSNTPNDGVEDITLPNVDAASCRFMVESADNIFYNLNTKNFAIEMNLSVDDNILANSLNVYPNPSKGEFTISFDSVLNNSSVKIDVYDISGRSVYKNIFVNESAQFNETINLNSVASGVYIANISNGNNITTAKIIIE
ncbi:zinc-dependent metalloprotease [Winogradskyella ludwigii]|uniref:zinc-dependent metalloprotease n=1 Tax=Winogradskyella ludwigii TaxID=2686076 RepID=UPI0015C6A688|nr:zinc-dependent metalloprotease [Winogradskyella ludwigii]